MSDLTPKTKTEMTPREALDYVLRCSCMREEPAISTLRRLIERTEEEKSPSDVTNSSEFNVNDHVYVQLTEFGRETARTAHEAAVASVPERVRHLVFYEEPKADAYGWTRWQLYELMQVFGPALRQAGPLQFETAIRFEEKRVNCPQCQGLGWSDRVATTPCSLCHSVCTLKEDVARAFQVGAARYKALYEDAMKSNVQLLHLRRERIATAALQGILAADPSIDTENAITATARVAVAFADALVAELNRKEGES